MQTLQTQIRLLLQEQFDQGLQCLPFRQVFHEITYNKKQNLGKKYGINCLKF